ncbi:MAG TPA: septal ring lytic transglycosylase RlpA family protein [Pseudolabrys sp.]|nr:septal ring lytic transglycosylase RlpA family protein [Pseudolabrys sp.]
MKIQVSPNVNQITRLLVVGSASLVLANCTADNIETRANHRHAAGSSRIAATGEITPKTEHLIRKRTVKLTHEHAPQKVANYTAVGVASWYGEDFQGRRTANGETFDMNSFSAAHPSLPLPSNVRITNLGNQRSVVVRVNDRGPFVGGRVIDVSAKTAKALGFYDDGLSKVKVEYVGRAQ